MIHKITIDKKRHVTFQLISPQFHLNSFFPKQKKMEESSPQETAKTSYKPRMLDPSLLDNIPTCNLDGETDFNLLNEFLISQENDYLNGLYLMLQGNGFKRPIKPHIPKTPIELAFDDFFNDINRRVVFFQHPPTPDSVFMIQPNHNIFNYFQPLYDWQVTQPRSSVNIGAHVTKPQNFFAYCCYFFRQMLNHNNNDSNNNNSHNINLNEWCLSYEIPNADEVISDALFDASDVQSYFEPELGVLFLLISKCPTRQLESHLPKPYVFDNGFCVKIHRSQNSFSYRMEFRDIFLINSGKDSIRLQPIESICVHFMYPFGCIVVFNEQTLYFDGERLILMENGQKPCYITIDGIWVSHKEMPVVIDQFGTIAQKIDDTWTAVTADMTTFVDGKQVQRKSSTITDFKTKTKSMIRPDGIEYYIDEDGTRKILFNIEFSVEQRKSGSTYDVPNFPLITLTDGQFTTQIDRFNFSFSKDKKVSFKAETYTAVFDGENLKVELPDNFQLNLSLDSCDVKSQTASFHASLNEADKFECSIPLEEINKKFPMRLFAIRSNLTGVEFLRKDSTLIQDAVTKKARIPHPYGGPVNVFAAHFKDLEKFPFVFIDNAPTNFEQDAKDIEKIFSDKIEAFKTEQGRASFLNDSSVFARGLETYLESEHERFIRENFEDGEEEDIVWPRPVIAPPPAVQIMQYNLYQQRVDRLTNGDVLNYFKGHEADFVIIENEYEIVEEEEEEEVNEVENVSSHVNQRLSSFEINSNELEFNQHFVINDVPPPPNVQ
ncbi:hypothetical protein TRFO_14357 [Tritrichomonas foetus]|uniref:Uncharacterized protein n=1 Tax=Tritrichomonas foetus TaxID=1144522 RepID=A0A1J4KWB0_9EUKA|nr:hypothetical protein TRFO_14357 [Tritrichomonas foetus]|eukprot:OHT15176.1 hypothetical protein TRFO_14357 [Tritrichomonas foetus]